MILFGKQRYELEPYELESDFEETVWDLRNELFGYNRLYFNFKKRIGTQGKTINIPDGYLIDLSSNTVPRIFVVENELAIHGLKHIAMQVLEFSLSYESSKLKIKQFLRDAIISDKNYKSIVDKYISDNNFENIDYFLDITLDIQKKSDINVLIIIDQIDDELEKALLEKFKFPIEILTIERYKNGDNYCYSFEPFMKDLSVVSVDIKNKSINSDLIDTIVVPAQEDGFNDTFLAENRWYEIRINATMIPKIKYIASYQVAPISAITYYAEVESIEAWKDSGKYVVNFKGKAQKIGPIKLIPKGKTKALQNTRYTSLTQLKTAKSLDEAFLS
jgi:hypothetical protein